MTKQQLNRDIKRMYKVYMKAYKNLKGDQYYDYISKELKPEFERLYHADSKAEYLSLDSLKIMMRINCTHRFISPPFFYINI